MNTTDAKKLAKILHDLFNRLDAALPYYISDKQRITAIKRCRDIADSALTIVEKSHPEILAASTSTPGA